ncbi:MAG TPA: hypothetical protein VFM11_00980 [Burkholderiales bacterium]|nr:hypothetical protein [Burkholderiales bacterium]
MNADKSYNRKGAKAQRVAKKNDCKNFSAFSLRLCAAVQDFSFSSSHAG